LAVDVVLLVDKDKDGNYETASWDRVIDFDGDGKSDFQEIVTLFKQYGWEWGGDWNFKDYPHFQKKFGNSVRDLLALHNSKKIDKQGYVIL
jgi:peptidoglycan L-alanyl-D-glutamate endopeptidase CwlK